MKTRTTLLLVSGLLSGVASAAPDSVWAPLSYYSATPWQKGVALFSDLSEGKYSGRRLFLRDGELMVAPSSQWLISAGTSQAVAFGRSSENRLRSGANRIGLRYALGQHRNTDFALQLDYVRGDEARIRTDDGTTTFSGRFGGARSIGVSLIATRRAWDTALGLSQVNVAKLRSTNLVATVGYRHSLGRDLTFRAQASVYGQAWTGDQTRNAFDLRTALRGRLSWQSSKWTSLNLDATLYPGGLPFDHVLGSFLLYEPSGSLAQSLRNDPVGFGSIGLTFTFKI